MERVFNFSAGPAALPAPVMRRVQEEFLNWRDGLSVIEVSHRGMPFDEVVAESNERLKTLLSIPDNYKVLFMQGGASLQFATVPLNLKGTKQSADYVLTGAWSEKAVKEAKKFLDVNIAASSKDAKYTEVPAYDSWQLSKDAAFCHITPNETIHGVEFHDLPDVGDAPLIADMSSTLLSRPIDVSKFGLIYAGAQKNLGPAGITLVIIREDLLEVNKDILPEMLDYAAMAKSDSLYNTPPTFSWYVVNHVLGWLLEQGGLPAMAEINEAKQAKLYQYIDSSDLYNNPVKPAYRSWMNIPFTLTDAALDSNFLAFADARGLKNLKGHRSVGGMRASIYNAMPMAGIDALLRVMTEFEKNH